jgi:hypothetical protein
MIGITLPAGSTVKLNGGDLLIGGTMSNSAGTATGIDDLGVGVTGSLAGGSGTISLSGDWSNSVIFTAGKGKVQVVDGCGITQSNLNIDNDFYDFSVTSAVGLTAHAEEWPFPGWAERRAWPRPASRPVPGLTFSMTWPLSHIPVLRGTGTS